MELTPPASQSLRHSSRLASRKHRFAKRLRFLLLGLKIVNAFGPPVEKLMLALIQECIAQIWPEPSGESSSLQSVAHRRNIAVSLGPRSSKARGL